MARRASDDPWQVELRARLAQEIDQRLGPFERSHLDAFVAVPREHFVRPADRTSAHLDRPLPLDDAGRSTISAPHAYLLSFRLLDLRPGDRVVELGSGTGYGAALAAAIVGPRGSVRTFEIDADLAATAKRLLADLPNVHVFCADAVESPMLWGDASRITCTFAVAEIPSEWLDALPEGGVLVAPRGDRHGNQRLVRVERKGGNLVESEHGAVRYVPNRSPQR